MKAFIVRIDQLFRMNTGKQDMLMNFNEEKRKLRIPLYQREYTWTDEKIITLVKDIKRHSKYLGNIILDEADLFYEIVDGQQRITTCFLILACLYNYYSGQQGEQSVLFRLMQPYNNEFILANDSVGKYITEKNGLLAITIDKEKDIYYQSESFERAYAKISAEFKNFKNFQDARDFRQNLLDCEMLVLINDKHVYNHPVEQLFLDINEKAQLLQVEDIFKGYCFKKYEENAHDELKALWIEFKKSAMGFKKFGYNDASQYIYLFLLETDTNAISSNLTTNGKHYLDEKTMDETEYILKEMIAYGQATIDFHNNLSNTDYRFVDLCKKSYDYRFTDDHLILKQMCKVMLENNAAQYQKLPLMYFIYMLRKNEEIVNSMSHKQFRKIITNLYIYMMLFVINGTKKSKNNIDYTIRNAISEGQDKIKQVELAAKNLRIEKVEEFILKENFGFDKLTFIYSIIDEYVAKDNWLKRIYSRGNGYTLEHFIIPDNRNGKVYWREEDSSKEFEFSLPADVVKSYKNNTINYLVINKELNESLEHDDIVSKICDIKTWYEQRQAVLPAHVSKIIEYIEDMPKFKALKDIKGTKATQVTIQSLYVEFVRDYFNLENNNLLQQMREAFVYSFHN